MAKKKKKIENYNIIEKVEETNYAVIYKVEDANKTLLVLKIALKKEPEYNALISREYQILSQFKHPNIVSVFDYSITKEKRAYFTLEYVSGKPINKCFNGFSEEFITSIIQVINGLGSFHNRGFIHSDLKPENILYNPQEKRAVLIDFGFAGIPTYSTELAGTIGYMAPEVIKGIGIDQRSDLYSLGVIIYEILSGKKFKETCVPIKDVPEEINNIIARLISREPAIRPTVPELYHTFSKYLTSIRIEIPPFEVELPKMGFVEIPEIVERLSAERGKTIIVSGDTGAGKTRLLREMKFRYLSQGYSVLYYISREKIKFYESLQHFTGGRKIDLSGKEDKFQIFEEITAGLINFAKDKDVIVMVDDLENLSDYDLGLFRYIGYGLQGTNILLIGGSKQDEREKGLGFETLFLQPFSIDDIEELLEKTFFEIVPAKNVGTSYLTDFAGWLQKQSGGNPLFIEEILKTLYVNKIVFYQTNRWQIKMDLLHKTAIPSKIENLLEMRLEGLRANEKKILQVLFLAGHPLETAIISLVLISEIDIEIEHLKSFGLLREEIINNRRVVYIPNQILTQLIERSLNRKEGKLLSRALIETIETTAPEDKGYLPILAQLCNRIGDKEKAYKYFQSSAKNAELIYDYDSALNHYDGMIKYEKDIIPSQYPETLIKIADINQLIGNNEIALEYYNKALKCRRKDLTPVIYTGMGRVYSGMEDYSEAVKFLRKAKILTKSKESQDYIKIAVYSLLYLKQSEEVKVILNQSFLSKKITSDAEILAETMYYQALYEWLKGNPDNGIKKAKENLRFTQKSKLFRQFAYMENLMSFLYQQKGDIEQAQEYLKDAIKRFKEMKLANVLANSLNNLAFLYMCQGSFSKAKELLNKVLIIAQQTNNASAQYIALGNLGSINENFGRFDEAINFYKAVLNIKPDLPMSNYNLAMVLYKKGEIYKAKLLIEEKSAKGEKIPYFFGIAMIDLNLGRIEQAEDALNKGLELMESANIDIQTKINLFLIAAQFYYEKRDFEKSLHFSKKVEELTHPLSREYSVVSSFIKICTFNLDKIDTIKITKEIERLKKIGCIYDYAYLEKLRIESLVNKGIAHEEVKNVVEKLDNIYEIFISVGAGSECDKVKTIQVKLFPIIAKDYSRRGISVEYLETFSRFAELISIHLGDEDFIQNTLDLIIQTTNAERGALFIKTSKGMEFCAGRDIDRTTIKDARELSKTAIKQIEKNKIIFSQDALSDTHFNIKKSVMLNKIRSLLCIPLVVSENVIGALYLDSRIVSAIFGHKDKDFLLTVSRILASVIEKSMAFRTLLEENILLKSRMIEEIGAGYIIGKSAPMKKVYRLIESVAQTNSPVLILGETGTGKGMLARLIHLKSKRKSNKFHTINCGTIPETLLESELFGYKKGAFTGAVSDKKGLLEEGESGTVFLDEITNTSPSFQAKFLEAIEEKRIRRLGETKTRNINVRFLFATNKELEKEVEEGRFRKDLFYRINVFSIDVPPLRKRVSDIPVLARFFLKRYSKEINKDIKGFSTDAIENLKVYSWPGNVRELQNIIERAVVLSEEDMIDIKDLGFVETIKREIVPLKELKKVAVIEALQKSSWNITKAAKFLNVTRRTIYKYIEKYNIHH
ncbi:sigma 54-interacting transcriptional regulator [candidate division WOR-3 bacterium]|nr:sigma 54-interacting transcriptional regulator [candidate division WOR-3 bacterium]